MRSKELADRAGVSVRTLRHYRDIGLLPEPARSDNGYCDYTTNDLVRVLRIKRLSGLGFSLGRVGEVIGRLDTPASTAACALDELDRELAAQIDQLEEQRRTIALLRREQLDPDLPVRFAQAIKQFETGEGSAGLSEEERVLLQLAAHTYDDDTISELEQVTNLIQERGLTDAALGLDRRIETLSAGADEDERASLVAEGLDLLSPLFPAFEAKNWDRPYTASELMLIDFHSTLLNEAQADVIDRIHCALEEHLIAQGTAQVADAPQSDPAHTSSTSPPPSLDPAATS